MDAPWWCRVVAAGSAWRSPSGAERHGANVVLLAKTGEPHPKLAGHGAHRRAEIEAAGGKALAVVGDVRDEEDVQRAVDAAVERFGGVDICVNNASAISVDPTEELSAKKFDLMQQINIRGTFLLTKACLPHLTPVAATAHVLTISPPLNMNPYWLGAHPSYTLSKYGMTCCRSAGPPSTPAQASVQLPVARDLHRDRRGGELGLRARR